MNFLTTGRGSRRLFATLLAAGATLTVTSTAITPAQAQFRIPGVPGIKLPGLSADNIPGLEKILREEEPLTTVITDSFAEVPFLDGFVPHQPAALPELPMGLNDDYLYLPGLYQIRAESYCLKAGTYVPRPGDGARAFAGRGYLYAPFKGPKAAIIDRIIKATMYHPEVPQHETQVLLWTVIARAKLSDCPPEVVNTARKLLSEKDLRALGDNALGVLPPEVQRKVMEKMPPFVRMALEAENRLREELKNQVAGITAPVNNAVGAVNAAGDSAVAPVSDLYRRMEQIAVLTGEPPEVPEKERIPWGRWTYHPDGYFLRLLPEGYSTTVRQVYHPERYEITRGESGRIASLKAPSGDTVEFVYEGQNALKALRLIRVDPARPAAPVTVTLQAARAIDLGGNATEPSMRAVEDSLKRQHKTLTGGNAAGEMRDLAGLSTAARALLAENTASIAEDKDWVRGQADRVTLAWMSAMARNASGDKVLALLPLPVEEQFPGARPQLASVSMQGWGGGGGGGFGGGGGGGAGMPGPGAQRLGQSNKKQKGPNSIDKARKAGNVLKKGTGKFIRTNGLTIPFSLANWHFNWILDNGQVMSDQISMDPPRADFSTYARPQRTETPKLPMTVKGVSPERRAAFESMMEALLDMRANLAAGVVSIDRHGGAREAKNAKWTYAQACALAHYKREAGRAMIVAADRIEKYASLLAKENAPDAPLTDAEVRAYKDRLRSAGFTDEEKQAAKQIGLTDAEIAASLQKRLKSSDYPVGMNEKEVLAEIAVGLRDLGEYYLLLHPITLPTADDGAIRTARH